MIIMFTADLFSQKMFFGFGLKVVKFSTVPYGNVFME